jgi:P-type conjugative transfer protein TrbJ
MRKLTFTALTLVVALPFLAAGGLPVIDYSNLIQNTTTALKQVAAYAQQVQQYQLQLQQYANMVRNTAAPVAQVWQQAQGTMNSVLGVSNMFRSGSSLEGYLSQFRDVNYWLTASPNQYQYQTAGSVLQKQSNDGLLRQVLEEQDQIRADAANLERLQTQAGSADGQMKALVAANELAALQEKSLLEIRALLSTQQQALATRNATLSNDEAMKQAATQQYFRTQLGPQPHTGW